MATLYDIHGNDFTPCAIRDVKKGEFITRKASINKVYVKGDYCRANKAYSIIDTTDHCRELFIKASTIVYIGFTY